MDTTKYVYWHLKKKVLWWVWRMDLTAPTPPADADDFDVEKGFVGDEEGKEAAWEGEDEDLDLAVSCGKAWFRN